MADEWEEVKKEPKKKEPEIPVIVEKLMYFSTEAQELASDVDALLKSADAARISDEHMTAFLELADKLEEKWSSINGKRRSS